MKGFRKKRGDVAERFVQYSDARAGCELHGGEWDEKAKKCSERQILDPDFPGDITTRSFDDVKKDRGGITTSRTEDE